MPQDITDVNTFTDPIVGPADGDPENAASVITPIQGLSNRTRYFKDLIAAASGLATLDATTHVTPAQLPYGLANGIAQADSTGRTPAASVRNGIVAMATMSATTMLAWVLTGASVPVAIGDIVLCFLSATGLGGSGHLLVSPSPTSPGPSLVFAPTASATAAKLAVSAESGAAFAFAVNGSSAGTCAFVGGTDGSPTLTSRGIAVTFVVIRP